MNQFNFSNNPNFIAGNFYYNQIKDLYVEIDKENKRSDQF